MQQEVPLKRGRGRPPKMDNGHLETKEKLLRMGTQVLTEKGFSSTGLDSILKEAGIPKGSFYHYFANKKAFGLAVIDNYNAYFCAKLDKWLLNDSRSPLDRLADFIADAKHGMERYRFKRGCLIGNLGQELAGVDETFRHPLEKVFLTWQTRVSRCLEEAQQQNEIAHHLNCQDLASFFWIGWEGAILRAKLAQSCDPLELFADQFFGMIKKNNPIENNRSENRESNSDYQRK
ncbi:acrylate utilization transcriptional regulator AcuR [Sneathiella aquimaris]|uniref:acrylate utilization transcriptional regulator AcuR n=2 Tax=Sneathiella aquimaris TaxID=2599305 RepID=UPI00146CC7DA|nr:TetR/AcrR family transcriptional regulator [Sneathiella aquimaris]